MPKKKTHKRQTAKDQRNNKAEVGFQVHTLLDTQRQAAAKTETVNQHVPFFLKSTLGGYTERVEQYALEASENFTMPNDSDFMKDSMSKAGSSNLMKQIVSFLDLPTLANELTDCKAKWAQSKAKNKTCDWDDLIPQEQMMHFVIFLVKDTYLPWKDEVGGMLVWAKDETLPPESIALAYEKEKVKGAAKWKEGESIMDAMNELKFFIQYMQSRVFVLKKQVEDNKKLHESSDEPFEKATTYATLKELIHSTAASANQEAFQKLHKMYATATCQLEAKTTELTSVKSVLVANVVNAHNLCEQMEVLWNECCQKLAEGGLVVQEVIKKEFSEYCNANFTTTKWDDICRLQRGYISIQWLLLGVCDNFCQEHANRVKNIDDRVSNYDKMFREWNESYEQTITKLKKQLKKKEEELQAVDSKYREQYEQIMKQKMHIMEMRVERQLQDMDIERHNEMIALETQMHDLRELDSQCEVQIQDCGQVLERIESSNLSLQTSLFFLNNTMRDQHVKMQNLEREKAELRLVHDSHQRHCQHLSDMATHLKALSNIDCLQDRIQAEVTQRTAALEQRHAAELRAIGEINSSKLDNMQLHHSAFQQKAQQELEEHKKSSAQALAKLQTDYEEQLTALRAENESKEISLRFNFEKKMGQITETMVSKEHHKTIVEGKNAKNRQLAYANYVLKNELRDVNAAAKALQEPHVETPGNPKLESAGDVKDKGKLQTSECNICMADYSSDVQWEVLSCSHLFCAECIHGRPGMKGLFEDENPKCPLCQQLVSKKTVRVIL